MTCLLNKFTPKIINLNICRYCSIYSKTIQESIEFSNGKKMKLIVPENIASGGDGIMSVEMEDTAMFVSAVAEEPKELAQGYLPLVVEYKQKFISSGFSPSRTLNSHLRNKEILIGRSIDRSIRPLFSKTMNHDIQLVCIERGSGLKHYLSDVLGINGASACLSVSTLPWNGPIAAVRVGHVNGDIIAFPTNKQLSESDLNLLVVSERKKNIVMLEGTGRNVKKDVIKKGINIAVKEGQLIINAIMSLTKKIGRSKRSIPCSNLPKEMIEDIRSLSKAKVKDILTTCTYNKKERDMKLFSIENDVIAELREKYKHETKNVFLMGCQSITNEVFRELILEDGLRVDGRKMDEIRPIHCSVNLFEHAHGSSRFERGQTIVESALAMEAPDRYAEIDPVTGLPTNFTLEYSFPPFANGITGKVGRQSRREIGHGILARKGLLPFIPETPYSLLVSTEVLSSNGSSSMATVCSGSMALMDAGINMSEHVAGVAIGLVTNLDNKGQLKDYKLLTDLLGFEDYFGDMDFKIAGTSKGITAMQADIKLSGIPLKIVTEAIDKALVANKEIITIMKKVIADPKTNKDNLPITEEIQLLPGQKILVLGIGGRNLRAIEEENGIFVNWETEDKMLIFAPNKKALEEAVKRIKHDMEDGRKEPPYGQICSAVIREVLDFGVMVELLPGMRSTLIGNDHLHTKKIRHPDDLDLKVGDSINVQYFGKDPVSGKFRLSRKSLLAPASATAAIKVKA